MSTNPKKPNKKEAQPNEKDTTNEDTKTMCPPSMQELDAIKIVLQWCDARVNGSVAAMIAVSFGAFSILRLYDDKPLHLLTYCFNPIDMWRWMWLTFGYLLIGFVGFYFFSRSVAYSTLANRKGWKAFPNGGTQQIIKDMKKELLLAEDLDSEFQRMSLWAINTKYVAEIVVFLIYLSAWLAVAIRII